MAMTTDGVSIPGNWRHGMSNTKVWIAWRSIHRRCYCARHPDYLGYGAKGISVCDRWRTFENFLADMGEPPTVFHALDRIDNNGNYEPGNCRWATPEQQANNRRNNRTYSCDGKTMTIAQWARASGVPYPRMYMRLTQLGWSIEDAIKP